MKKIKNSDFIIQIPSEVAGKELSTGDYVSLKLYTVNSDNYTLFTYEGGVVPEEQKVDASRFSTMETGVVQMVLSSHIYDTSMPDSYLDIAYQATTDYYWIRDTRESAQEQINQLRADLADEELVREAADRELAEEISGLSYSMDVDFYDISEMDAILEHYATDEELQALDEKKLDASAYTPYDDSQVTADITALQNNKLDKSTFNTYSANTADALARKADVRDLDSYETKTAHTADINTINATLANKLDASAYTPTDLSNYYNKQEVDSAISASVEDNKVLYVQFEEVQGDTALTCSHTFAQIYEAYSEGRVVVGQFRNVDLRMIACNENAYMFFGMFYNRAGYVGGSKNINQEDIGFQFIDFTIEMDDVPTANSQKAVKSAGIYNEMSDKVDKTAFNSFSSSTASELNILDQVKLDASAYTAYDDTQVLADIAALQTDKLDASAYTPTDLSNYYNKSEVDAAVSGKVDNSTFESFDLATSAALTDLHDTKLDASAYTPTDLSNYYNKSEVDAAVSGKMDTSTFNTYSGATATEINAKPNLVTLTQAQYDQIQTPDPNTLYVISDASPVDISTKLDASAYTPVTIDSALNTGSTNPVQNAVVSTNLNSKLNTSDFNSYSGSVATQIGDINTILNNINGNS